MNKETKHAQITVQKWLSIMTKRQQ